MNISFKKFFAVALLPVACGWFAIELLRVQQPYWGGRLSDPSYIYLLSSLNLATFAAPGHVDHPGTPVQVIGALTLRVLHPTLGSNELATIVLADPEHHAHAISVVLIVIAALASLAAGVWLLRHTGRLDAALCAQVGPVLFTNVLAGYSGLRPEPLLIAASHLWIAAVIAWSEGRFDLGARRNILVLAALGGGAVATKYTFVPLLLLPLVLVQTWRKRTIFAVGAGVSFFICISPALPQLRRLASWVFRLGVRDGAYGRGRLSWGPAQGWAGAISETLQANSIFAALLALTIVGVAIAWHQRARHPAVEAHLRLGFAGAFALVAAIIMVAKQASGSGRYLLPAAACLPIAFYAVWRCFADEWPAAARRAAGTVAVLLALTMAVSSMSHQLSAARFDRAGALATRDWITSNLAHETVVPYYGASSVPFALSQAEIYANHWSAALARLYPRFVCYALWNGGFRRDFSPNPSPAPDGVFYLTGAPLVGGVLNDAFHSIPWELTLVWTNDAEAVYRAAPRLTPPPT